jgi:adenylate kinase
MKNSKNLKFIIVMGPPGSGKGTQAELLAEKFGLYHLETSEIIERNLRDIKKGDYVLVNGKKYFLIEEKKKRESGELMSSPLIAFWVKNKIEKITKEEKGLVTSGAFRTLPETKELVSFLKKLYGKENIKVILLTLSDKEVIWRGSRRKTCELMRHPILFTKETEKLKKCPFDGSKLLLRKDDTPEVIKVRLGKYRQDTMPSIEYLKRADLKVIKIDGSPPPAIVFQNILKSLNPK